MEKANKLLLQLQELTFAFIEMKLYLDTHPFDPKVHQDLIRVSREMEMLMPQVERFYGPLCGHKFMENPARWITEPWPWELMY